MIKINFIEKKKRQQEVVFAGVNIREIRWVPLLIGAIWYTFDFDTMILNGLFESREKLVNDEITKLTAEKNKLMQEKVGLKSLDDEIKKFELVEKRLQTRLVAVKDVISQRKNPQGIMLYISKSIPSDVWLSDFSINQSDFELSGKSSNYRSIGTFLEALRGSTYFDSELRLASTSTEQAKESNKRSEVFKIQGKISRFE